MKYMVTYAELWRLLRRRGLRYRLVNDGKHRMWGDDSEEGMLTLSNEPLDEFVFPTWLFGTRLVLENFGVMPREDFDVWMWKRTKAREAKENGTASKTKPTVANGRRRKGAPRKDPSQG